MAALHSIATRELSPPAHWTQETNREMSEALVRRGASRWPGFFFSAAVGVRVRASAMLGKKSAQARGSAATSGTLLRVRHVRGCAGGTDCSQLCD